jgi:hypothetical protein
MISSVHNTKIIEVIFTMSSSGWRLVNKSSEPNTVEQNEGTNLVVKRNLQESSENSNVLWLNDLEAQTEGGVEETSSYPFEIQQVDPIRRQVLYRYGWVICVGFSMIVIMFVTFVVLLVIHDHRRVHS